MENKSIQSFKSYLEHEERSVNTTEKYVRDVTAFYKWLDARKLTKDEVIAYKQYLSDAGYKIRSINSILAALGSYFVFLGRAELKVKSFRLQREVYCEENRELTREEYQRLCQAAEHRHNERLSLLLQTICGTGIRVSELAFITAEAVRRGAAVVSLKGKTRTILLVKPLQIKLLRYIRKHGIATGPVFLTKSGKPISRTTVWREMKSLCAEAAVDSRKVFPHNLRHLFARVFYAIDKDIARLADILGHSSIETTRVYIISTGTEHRRLLERMRLIL